MNDSKKGLFLLNLGTPESPSTKDVRKYLDEFLNDPYVIDLPKIFRKILVNGIILNTRPKKSAEAYQQIWTKDGSPLMIHTRALTDKVRRVINQNRAETDRIEVKMGMRYGKPSISETLKAFQKDQVSEIVFLPLYPQYSYAASESSLAEFERLKNQIAPQIKVKTIEDFFNDPRFISALANSMKDAIARFKPDVLLLSYHGIPERQIAKIKNAPTECCSPGCCDQWDQRNLQCYRAQCYETSRLLAKALDLPIEKVVTSFQSRLGRTKWIEPYTDFLLKDFPGQGIKRIMVASPSFTADCLETLEEIRIRYDELFKESGGLEFEYIPCLNSRDDFAEFVSALAKEKIFT